MTKVSAAARARPSAQVTNYLQPAAMAKRASVYRAGLPRPHKLTISSECLFQREASRSQRPDAILLEPGTRLKPSECGGNLDADAFVRDIAAREKNVERGKTTGVRLDGAGCAEGTGDLGVEHATRLKVREDLQTERDSL